MAEDLRLGALRRFAVAITVLNIAGHLILGFEQSLVQVLASLGTAYSLEILLEIIEARANRRSFKFAGGPAAFRDFLLPAHITGLAVPMLLYANDRVLPIVFATTAAICSKMIFRAPVGKGWRHFLNPSNAGIAATLALFPWIAISPPYQFTENITGIGHWILPCVFIFTGTFLNTRFTHRLPLILAWLGGFALQAFIRNLLLGTPWIGGLVPMTGVPFLLFTFYMVTDPATTPIKTSRQICFGFAVAVAYAAMMMLHIGFGLFFALALVCTLRGLGLYVLAYKTRPVVQSAPEAAVALREAEL